MRPIKFRGKAKYNGQWLYGSYMFTDDNKNDPFRYAPFRESHKIIFWCSGDWNMGGWCDEEVYKETVGQFTGLYDKAGEEIYEGDIIRSFDSNGTSVYHHIEYNEKEARFVAVLNDPGVSRSRIESSLTQDWINEFEKVIIGNIHDNKDYLE